MTKQTKWYDSINFYRLTLVNGEKLYWWSELPLSEIKGSIGKEDFVLISSGQGDYYREEDINTKVIRSVQDVTEKTRREFRKTDEEFARRMELVQNIRKSKQPFAVQRVIRKTEKQFRKQKENNEWESYERDNGTDIDVLMHYNENYLRKLLEMCKKIDLVS